MNVRLSPEEKILFQQAATLASLSLSEWVRKVLLAAAQPVRHSEPGEGVLRMEQGKYVPILPEYIAVITNPAVPLEAVTIDPAPTVTAPPPPPAPEPFPEPVVTPAPARPMSMVDRMYAIIEARDGKEKADFWLLTNAKRK